MLSVPGNLLRIIEVWRLKKKAHYLECEETSLRLELLVRARGRIRCECVAYASPELQRHMMDYITDTLKELKIPN